VKTQPQAQSKLRRLALERQGLLKTAPFGRGKNATQKAVEQLGYVQIDTISVVARAHNHVLRTRVPNYDPSHIDKLQDDGRIFEYWYHAAAYLPMCDYRFALPRMRAMARGEGRWQRSRDQKLMADVHDYIRANGPTRARDFENPADHRAGWWNWKPAKQALEQLFMQGDLMVRGREGFQKVYDLTERILPAHAITHEPDHRELASYLLRTTLRSYGFATQKSVTYLRAGSALRVALKTELEDAVAAQRLVAFKLPTGETAYGDPEVLDTRAASTAARVKILSPFDNAIIQRDRNIAVFDFDYQIECYVTEQKRKFGYFCLPLLYRDHFVGRADCKAHRKTGVFEVKSLHVEHADLDVDSAAEFAVALHEAMAEFARFNGCGEVRYKRVYPRTWTRLIGPGFQLTDVLG